MDWIETTGKTIEEAKERALDELGVDEQDAEFEIVAEPKTGLFGRMRVEARVRSRVRPTAPRPKDDRRDRRRKPKADKSSGASAGADTTRTVPAGEMASGAVAVAESPTKGPRTAAPKDGGGETSRSSAGAGNGRGPRRAAGKRENERDDKVANTDVSLEEQAEAAREFLLGLVQEFGLTAEITAAPGKEDTIEVAIEGDNLGLLIGPKGATLLAVQDLTRSAVQQKTNAGNGRIHVDVSGYRQKRSEALARFARQIAEQVRTSGVRQALEPMSAVDRKVIHDALTDFDGIATISEGEDTGRRVVIVPQSA